MTVEEAQRDVRSELMGGFFGQLVSGVLWGVSAALTTAIQRARGFAG